VIAEERHLLSSDTVLVKTTIEDQGRTVGYQDGNHDRQEKADRIGGLHHDYSETVSEPGVAAEHGGSANHDERLATYSQN
jgi:hypothetical protein